jgi:hypothetical protein
MNRSLGTAATYGAYDDARQSAGKDNAQYDGIVNDDGRRIGLATFAVVGCATVCALDVTE